MASENKVTREYRVTVTVEELDVPKVPEIPVVPQPLSDAAEDFIDEEDYSPGA